MKRTVFPGIMVFALLFLPICSFAQDPVDVSDEIMAVNETFMKAIQSADVETLVHLYTGDARVLPPNSPALEGSESIAGMWEVMFEPGPMNLQLKTVSAEAFGATAVEEGTYEVLLPDGQSVDKGKYIVIWKKVDGKWLLHRDIFNTSMPASGM